MNLSIRTKFTLAIVFFFIIIATLSIVSAIHLNKLSKKTGSILKDNHLSVVYARDMSESLLNINLEITKSIIGIEMPDSNIINNSLWQFEKSLNLEKNNITEVGEGDLVTGIESEFRLYCAEITELRKTNKLSALILNLQASHKSLDHQLVLLSQMNENAIERKTNDAKELARKALFQVTILGTLGFLLAFSFTYSFASYFNERFFQLYNGIKEIVSSNYGHRLHFEGKDEFYDISLIFNKMADNLSQAKQKISISLDDLTEPRVRVEDVDELKRLLVNMKRFEDEAKVLISKLEKQKE
jgi:methyl-accepting chemotaxis protein